MGSLGLLVLRLGTGGVMAWAHGWDKLKSLLEEPGASFQPMLGMTAAVAHACATGAEFFGSLLIVIGLATRVGAAAVAFTMAVAFFLVHAEDPFKVKELACLYLVASTALVFTGAGRFSLDALLGRK